MMPNAILLSYFQGDCITRTYCIINDQPATFQVGRARISSDSDDEKQRDSGVSTHDEDEERINKRKKIDNRSRPNFQIFFHFLSMIRHDE